MTTMISEVYEEALSAESLATKGDIRRLEKELLVIKWMLGLIIAVEILPYLKAVFV